MKLRFGRRRFLRGTFSGLGAFIAARVGWLFPEGRQVFARVGRTVQENVALQPPVEGELYAGFVLLPEGTPVPAFVKYPERKLPFVCGLGRSDAEPSTAVRSFLKTPTDLANVVSFPIYTLSKLRGGLRLTNASLVQYETGEVFAASVNFGSFDENGGSKGTVSISAQPDFPKPFPLWSSDPVELGGPAVILEKVDFLPLSGIMIATQTGYVFHWIEEDIFYTMMTEYNPSREEAQALVGLLVSVQ